jgi:hypothetical protein
MCAGSGFCPCRCICHPVAIAMSKRGESAAFYFVADVTFSSPASCCGTGGGGDYLPFAPVVGVVWVDYACAAAWVSARGKGECED